MAFDPDAYLAAAAPSKKPFNPDAYLGGHEFTPAEEKELTDFEKKTILKESARGAGGGITAGLGKALDAVTFGIPVLDYAGAGANFLAGKVRGDGKDFEHELAYTRALRRASEGQHETAANVGTGVGTVASFAMPGGAIAKGAGKVIEAAPMVGKVATKFPELAKAIGSVGGQAVESGTLGALAGAGKGYGTEEGALSGALKEGALGAGLGAGVGGLVAGAKPLMKGLVTTTTGRDYGLVSKYYDRLDKVKAAPDLEGVADEFGGLAIKTREDLLGGGKEVARILDDSRISYKKGYLQDQITRHFEELKNKTSDNSIRSALEKKKQDMLDGIEGLSGGANTIPAKQVKNIIDDLGEIASYGPDKASRVQDAAKGARATLSDELKANIPGYADKMAEQAESAAALSRLGVKPVRQPDGSFGFDEGMMDNFMKRIAKGDRTATQKAEQIAEAQGLAPGAFTERVQDSFLKSAFDTQRPNGSRNVNMFANLGSTAGEKLNLPGAGRMLGSVMGYGADKFAAPVMKRVMDVSKNIEASWGRLGPVAQRQLQAAAARGPMELIATHSELLKRDPVYRDALGEVK